MKIRNIRVTSDHNTITFQADCTIRRFGPDTLYFKFDKKYQDFFYNDASPFAAALLLPSMKLGEDLVIEGTISQKLHEGMQQLMSPEILKGLGLRRINIHVNDVIKDTHHPTKIASFFSGGVDSFYTYMHHRKGKDAVQYFLLVNGFDIELSNNELWKTTRKTVEKIAKKDGNIAVITLESNLRSTIDLITPWSYSFAGGSAAIALLLRNNIRKVYKPSSFKYGQVSGPTDGIIDTYFQTETLSFVHDGAEASRVEKIITIAASKIALDNLRVCYMNKKGVYNCGTCDKCLRTMIGLIIAGKLDQAKTFPHEIDRERIKTLLITNKFGAIFHKENLNELEKSHIDQELQQAIRTCLQNASYGPSFVTEFFSRGAYIDYMYFRGNVRKMLTLGRALT